MREVEQVLATSSPTGLSIICRRFQDSEYVRDVYTAKMVINPETGERYLSFAPLNALALMQGMTYAEFVALANRGVNCGIYEPHNPVKAAYLDFVNDEDKKSIMARYYLEESGPLQEFLDKKDSEKCANVSVEKKEPACDGNVITAPFGRN